MRRKLKNRIRSARKRKRIYQRSGKGIIYTKK